jgi:hypothetical protein
MKHIDEPFTEDPSVSAVFNCTGLGSYSLGGVEDHKLYPTKVVNPCLYRSKLFNRSTN